MRGLVGGAFDIIHAGHEFFLKKAKEMAGELIVVIATDETVQKSKGRPPVNGQEQRRAQVASLPYVDKAVIGGEGNWLPTVNEIRPDIIIFGHDQHFPDFEEEIKFAYPDMEIAHIDEQLPGHSSSSISGHPKR